MAAMNPILRLRRAFRSIGADAQQADEAAGAVDDYSYSRRESDLRHAQMMAEMRELMADQTNRILLGMFVLLSIAVGVILAFVA